MRAYNLSGANSGIKPATLESTHSTTPAFGLSNVCNSDKMRIKPLLSRGTVRSTSALVMLAYVICHLGNHILLLISISFADEASPFPD
jgi:hypothetical protein